MYKIAYIAVRWAPRGGAYDKVAEYPLMQRKNGFANLLRLAAVVRPNTTRMSAIVVAGVNGSFTCAVDLFRAPACCACPRECAVFTRSFTLRAYTLALMFNQMYYLVANDAIFLV
jgi:hypothetical protein